MPDMKQNLEYFSSRQKRYFTYFISLHKGKLKREIYISHWGSDILITFSIEIQ